MGGPEKSKKKGIHFGLPLRLHHHHHHGADGESLKSAKSKAGTVGTATESPETPQSKEARNASNGTPQSTAQQDESIEFSPFASAIPHSPGSVTYNKSALAQETGGTPFPPVQARPTPERNASSGTQHLVANGSPAAIGGTEASLHRGSSVRHSRQSTPGLDASDIDVDDVEADIDAESNISSQQAVSIMLCEAVVDTPAFRASANYIDTQFKDLTSWLAGLTARSANHASHMGSIKRSINGVIEHFMPPFTNNSILLQDYTTLLFSTFAASESSFWTDLIAQVQLSNDALQAAVTRLNQGVLARYSKARAAYVSALRDHDANLQAVMRLPADAEPAALRDAAHRSHNYTRALAKASTALVLAIGDVESEASLTLMDTLSAQSLGRNGVAHGLSRDRAEVVINMHRIRSLSARLRSGFPDISSDLRAMRSRILQRNHTESPSKDLASYNGQDDGMTPEDTEQSHKFGWVYMRIEHNKSEHNHHSHHDSSGSAQTDSPLQQYWAFVQNGFFGALTLDKAGTSVVESVKLATNTIEIQEPSPKAARANMFTVRSAEYTAYVQTESRKELMRWLNTLKKSHDEQIALPPVIMPWSPNFATSEAVELASNLPDANLVAVRVQEVGSDVRRSDWLRPDSTLTSEGATIPIHTIPAVKPLPTAHMGDALVANWFFQPQGMPNAMTSNFWGVLNWLHPTTKAIYSRGFPMYPENYPRRLIVQDGDMRSIACQLPLDQQPARDDFLLFIVRGTAMVQKREVPMRLYVTSHVIVLYTSWRGLVTVQGLDISRIVDIETHHGVDFSDLRIVFQTDGGGDSHILPFRLYVDSGTLVKRKFSIIIENLRSRHPMKPSDLFEHLALVNIEYAEALRKEETRKQGELVRPGHSNSASNGLAGFLLEKAVGSGTQRGEEDTLQIGKGMQTKISEDTFPIPAEALFLTMFGSKSPVFSGDFTGVVHGSSKASPWYRRGRFIERKVVQHATVMGSDDSSTQHEMFHYQRVEQKDPEFYIVTERRSAWEMPHGDQFYLVFKYCIYTTVQGCHIQIWNKVVWTKKSAVGKTSEDTVTEFARMGIRTIMLRTRKAASYVSNTKEAVQKFGTVRATRVLQGKESRQLEQTVTRVSARSFFSFMMQLPLRALLVSVKFLVSTTFSWICTLSSPLLILLGTSLLSLLLNVILYHRSSVAYWSAYLEEKDTNRFIETTNLLPERGSVFRRAIYTQDINDAITDGVLWGPEGIHNGIGVSLQKQSNASQCSSRFGEIARLAWTDEYDHLYEYEPSVLQTLRRIADVRQFYALRRTDMLSRLRVLNANEREQLMHEYRKWLVSETTMCSLVRPELAKLNTSVIHEVREYCLSCLEEAKGLL